MFSSRILVSSQEIFLVPLLLAGDEGMTFYFFVFVFATNISFYVWFMIIFHYLWLFFFQNKQSLGPYSNICYQFKFALNFCDIHYYVLMWSIVTGGPNSFSLLFFQSNVLLHLSAICLLDSTYHVMNFTRSLEWGLESHILLFGSFRCN